jgi:Ca-activated chloride channel family protein
VSFRWLIVAGTAVILAAAPLRGGDTPTDRSTSASPLSREEREWIEDIVAPLATPEEKKTYLSLPAPYQRSAFREEFWRIREKEGLKAPFGPGFKNLYEQRLALANEKYDGWRSDAGRIVLARGEPLQVVSIDCPDVYRPIEVWTLAAAPDKTSTLTLIFYRDFAGGPRKLWTPILGGEALLSPAKSGSGQSLSQGFLARCGTASRSIEAPCSKECDVLYPAYAGQRQQGDLAAFSDLATFTRYPEPVEADWDRWRTRFVEGGVLSKEKKAELTLESPKAEAPSSPARKLTKEERKKLTAALPERYREWLSEVEIVITDAERDVFLQIKEDVDRQKFIDEFWRRRSVDKDGIRTNFREIFERRIEYCKENFKSLSSDASKVLLLNGPPDAVIAINCEELFVPIRIWYYERLEALKSKVYLIFYKRYAMGDWTLWVPFDGMDRLSLNGQILNMRSAQNQCFDVQTLQQAIAFETVVLGSGISGSAEAAKMFAPPLVETEGIDRFLGLTTQISAGAAPLSVDKSLIFPEEKDNKIACDISLLIPRKELALRDLGQEKFYDVDVVGEVVHEDRLIDNFKYRFDIPWDEVGGDRLPLTVRRYLYPGDYELRIKAGDANRKAEGRIVEKLKVPERPEAPPLAAAAAAGRPKPAPSDFRPSSIAILPPVREILTGLQRFETHAAVGIQAVDFYLDGTKVLTRTRQPFDADLNLGPLPRKHTIKAVAYDRQGRAVGEDELSINEGSEAFRVKILSPMRGSKASGPTEVVADATAPEGRKITKLEFYSNETLIATLYQPPWHQIVPIRKTGSLGYFRVVGMLDDGLVAEDLRYVNAPAYISEVNVDAVELYTTVTEKHRPVEGLTADNFKVLEDGKEQQIAHFEQVRNLPLTVGVAIDTSASMIENLPEAEKAAVEFIDATINPKDRGFTMSFDDAPYTLCKLTTSREALERSFAGLRAEGSTALYDAIIYALYQFQGVKGKKALVLLTDGKDTSSKYDFDILLDYVKKAGVSVYGIGLNISKAEFEVKSKLNRLAEASGGTTFYINSAARLGAVYKQINDELRTQYLLTYYSSNPSPDNKWRKIDVKTKPPTLVARTISGYYP